MRSRKRSTAVPYPFSTGTVMVYGKQSASAEWLPVTGYPRTDNISSTWMNRLYSTVETCQDELHHGPPYKTGGPFSLWRSTDPILDLRNIGTHMCIYPDILSIGNGADYSKSWPKYKYIYTGGFICRQPPLYPLSSVKDLYGGGNWNAAGLLDQSHRGPTGFKMFQPIKPVINLGQFAYEIREVPRMLKTTAEGFHNLWKSFGGHPVDFKPKHLADHFLNFQFGWKPFIKDMKDMFSYQKKAARQYQHLVNANGKWRRRGGTVFEDQTQSMATSTTTAHYAAGPSSAFTSYASNRVGSVFSKIYDITRHRVWFEGAFKFWIPNLEPYDEWSRDYGRRLGLEISPTLLYNITPWTWLIDWFSNLGDNIDNFTTRDQYAAKYAYLMAETQRIKKVESTYPFAGTDLQATWEYPMTRKQRVEASPYGFNLGWDDFSPIQIAILAALGITRMS